jgi:hypothetical protein
MISVQKYALSMGKEIKLNLHQEACLLGVYLQANGYFLFVQQDDAKPMEPVTIYPVGNNQPLPEKAKSYIGSMVNQSHEWHFYV